MKIKDILSELRNVMEKWEYPIQNPVKNSFFESLTKRKNHSNGSITLEKLINEIHILLVNQPDYVTFLEEMDGFEYDGVVLFSLSVPEPIVKNILVINEYYRNNDDYIDPDIVGRLVVGENSTSLFTYDIKTNLFEIRDSASSESVYGSFDTFSEFLSEILSTVK